MAPARTAAKTTTFQYVVGYSNGEAVQYEYPNGLQPTGRVVTGLNNPQGVCSIGKQAFWIVNSGANDLIEFSYNIGKQIRSLTETVANPTNCSVSARNGDIAVTFLEPADVIVFKGGAQSGETTYTLPGTPYFPGYDAKGNLFVDGLSSNGSAILLKQASGSKTFEPVTLPNTLQFPGSVQWDGRYLAVTDQLSSEIYRYAVTGYSAALKGTVSLAGASDCADTWIGLPYVFCADAGTGVNEVYKYPAGGTSIATLAQGSNGPIVQVSK